MLLRVISVAAFRPMSAEPALPHRPSSRHLARRRQREGTRGRAWDGVEIFPGAEIPAWRSGARVDRARRTFAERRGYRVDLDGSQRIVLVSDDERFRNVSRSLAIVESVLARTAAFTGPRETPITIFRASNEDDAQTARVAADGLGFGGHVFVHVETGTLRERRAVDARLAEAVVRAELTAHAPFRRMADGIASAIANETTERGIVCGEAESFRSVQSSVSRTARKRDRRSVDLFEVSGVAPGEEAALEAEAMAIVAFLRKHHETAFADIVVQLGANARPGRASTTMRRTRCAALRPRRARGDRAALRKRRAYRKR